MTCGSCVHWKTLGLPKRDTDYRIGFAATVGAPPVTKRAEVRDCACLAGRRGEQREDAEACDEHKERGK